MSIPKIDSKFFMKHFTFRDGTLAVAIGLDDAQIPDEIIFDYVRSFIFLTESDFHSDFAKYQIEPVISGGERTLGVFKITKSSIAERLLSEDVKSEQPTIYWLSTPDECLEIVSFAEPKIIPASQYNHGIKGSEQDNANHELVKILEDLIEKHRNMRFSQILLNWGFTQVEPGADPLWKNDYPLASADLLKRIGLVK